MQQRRRELAAMISLDTNLLFHAYNADSPSHEAAFRWIKSIQSSEEVAISEFILAEFYGLLRNPKILNAPLSASNAASVIQSHRQHPRWRLIGFPSESRSLHNALWEKSASGDFAFRRLYDVRTAMTLVAQGVTVFATVNMKDFEGLGFERVWNPLSEC
jgi:uncharacterized protein